MSTDRNAPAYIRSTPEAAALARDPHTPDFVLAQIALHTPELRPVIQQNPATRTELSQWISKRSAAESGTARASQQGRPKGVLALIVSGISLLVAIAALTIFVIWEWPIPAGTTGVVSVAIALLAAAVAKGKFRTA
ncbi:hypothetical protein EF294_02535 [Gordonia oryzae]|uniref:Leucine rich repeat variant domain-containing protein n=1 Tax=Gordonia oryzae TaxID=2487349 RepID=A0A3N4GS65_9ACTN|nr:hypothetical protein [Gordonia oryzae]RPA65652.1 hypothetical protein EF294_02535 [Gordonia oryzae]